MFASFLHSYPQSRKAKESDVMQKLTCLTALLHANAHGLPSGPRRRSRVAVQRWQQRYTNIRSCGIVKPPCMHSYTPSTKAMHNSYSLPCSGPWPPTTPNACQLCCRLWIISTARCQVRLAPQAAMPAFTTTSAVQVSWLGGWCSNLPVWDLGSTAQFVCDVCGFTGFGFSGDLKLFVRALLGSPALLSLNFGTYEPKL